MDTIIVRIFKRNGRNKAIHSIVNATNGHQCKWHHMTVSEARKAIKCAESNRPYNVGGMVGLANVQVHPLSLR